MIKWDVEKIIQVKRLTNTSWNIMDSILDYSGLKVRVDYCKSMNKNIVSKKLSNEVLTDALVPLVLSEISKVEVEIKEKIDALKEIIVGLENED